MSENDKNGDSEALTQRGLIVVAAVSLGCALLHVIFPDRFDEKTAMFLAVAIVALVIHQITKFKGFGIEFEKEVKQLREDVKNVEAAFGGLEKDLGPGSKAAVGLPRTAAADQDLVDPNDPNKGRFGGSPTANGRKLSAVITPDAGPRSARCLVAVKVESTDPSRPLQGTITIHLHPTFGAGETYELKVAGGTVINEIISYGAFTIGVEADKGATRLELDLMDVPGGTELFYDQ